MSPATSTIAVAYTVGKHEFRFGGEFRKSQVFDFYQTGSRGVFLFDGSQGPWSQNGGSAACDALANGGTPPPVETVRHLDPITPTDGNVLLLADFMAGCVSTNNAYIAEGIRSVPSTKTRGISSRRMRGRLRRS